MEVFDEFCVPKMLSKGEEKINPYNILNQNILMRLHFPILKLDLKRRIQPTTFLYLGFF